MRKKRLIYLSASLILWAVEVLIALFVHDRFIRPFGGDVLVVILVYSFVRTIFPAGIRLLPLYVFLFACFVEWMQYLNLIETLGLSGNALARVVLGTSFSWGDILCYGAGCLIIVALEKWLHGPRHY